MQRLQQDAAPGALDRALTGIAAGRLLLGTAAWMAPRLSARVYFGTRDTSPELAYMMRIFGARAIALGSFFLLGPDATARRRARRIALLVDLADTAMGPRTGLPRGSATSSTALTGAYATVGLLALARDRRQRRPA